MDFPLFVYGTLKTGFPANARWCSRAGVPIAARSAGSLFLHADGYPVLFLEPDAVLAIGSADVEQDARIARQPGTQPGIGLDFLGPLEGSRAAVSAAEMTAGVLGELLIFPRGTLLLAALDAYECFTPGAPSLFVRALARIELLDTHEQRYAWTYVAGRLMANTPLTRLPNGRWPGR